MSAFKNKNSLRTIEAEISQKVKNNEARPKLTGSYKKCVYDCLINVQTCQFSFVNVGFV